ncbi:MAG TPA: hypothetical protein VF615_11640 [Longimicrobiaceae bacterium]|jgi:hypothetical protein
MKRKAQGGFHSAGILLVLLITLFAPPRAWGQEAATAEEEEQAAAVLQRALVTPSTTAAIQSSVPVFFLAGDADKLEARIRGGFALTQDPTFGRLYATLGLTAPLSGDADKPTIFGDLGGLAQGTKLSLSVTGQRWAWANSGPDDTAWCRQKVRQGRAAQGVTEQDCEDFNLTKVVGEDQGLEREYFLEVETNQPVLYEVSAWYQPTTMGYLDATTYLPAALERSSGAVGASIGRFFGNHLWSLSYRYEVGYAEGPQAEVCTPLGGTGALRCRKAPLGEPQREEGSVGALQTRGYLRRNLAWNPRLVLRFRDDAWGIESPIYFVPGEAGLVGGVTPSYDSLTDGWAFTVFFGKAFRVGL